MIICLDVGNTHIAIGIYDNDLLLYKFRVATNSQITSDEYGIKLMQLLEFNKIKKEDITGFIVSSVVPNVDFAVKSMCKQYLGLEAIFVGPGIKSGIHIKLDNPKQLGADLLVGAVSTLEKYGTKALIIDMGTAITFVYVNEHKEFLGGSILPGMHTAYNSLINKTSKLEIVEFDDTISLIGKDTKSCLQSGMVYGWSSLISGLIKKYQKELGDIKIVITGGEAQFLIDKIDQDIKYIYDDNLLLDGLNILYKRNYK